MREAPPGLAALCARFVAHPFDPPAYHKNESLQPIYLRLDPCPQDESFWPMCVCFALSILERLGGPERV